MVVANLTLLLFFTSLTLVLRTEGRSRRQFTIAAIFDGGDDPKHKLAFQRAVHTVNRNSKILPNIDLAPKVVEISKHDSFAAERETCRLLENGVVAILGPQSKPSSEHVRIIADAMEIPFLETRWNFHTSKDRLSQGFEYQLNLHPDISSMSAAYLELLEAYSWTSITILFQDNDSMKTLKELFRRTTMPGINGKLQLIVKRLTLNKNGYRDILQEILVSGSKLIVVDCEKGILEEVLKQCQQVGEVCKN